MTDRSVQSQLLALLVRFLLCLALLVLTFPTGLSLFLRLAAPRLTSGDATEARAGDRSIEIISPLDGFTGLPKPTIRPDEPTRPDDSSLRRGERWIVAPNAPAGSYPMVEGVAGRLYQLTPGGGRHPVDVGELMRWAAERDGLETELIQEDADGKREPVKLRRWFR
jgi:hypothetical protein